MKVLITGAHFTPAQAVIEELKKFKVEVVYVGRKYTQEGDKTVSVESQILPTLGVKFIPITTGRLRRIIEIKSLISLLKIPIGFIQAFYILIREQPKIVLSFGGYVAVPVVIVAWLLNIPIIIHEQTLVSGLANKITSFFATKIAVTFDKKYEFVSKKIVLTGNPIRKELLASSQKVSVDVEKLLKLKNQQKLPLIYVTGGNQGSLVINKAVSKILDYLTGIAVVIHQTGDSELFDFDKQLELKEGLKNKGRYLPQKWFDVGDVGAIYKQADLVISRAGANTLLELAYFGIPTIVVPLPYLHKDEQNVNAKFFEEKGLVQIMPQVHFNEQTLMNKINYILKDLDEFKQDASQAKEVVILNASQKLTQEVLKYS